MLLDFNALNPIICSIMMNIITCKQGRSHVKTKGGHYPCQLLLKNSNGIYC